MNGIAILILLCVVNFAIANLRVKPFYNIIEAEPLFKRFKDLYGKKYMTRAEEQMRLKIFTNTLEDINYLNSINSDAVFDINEYADISKSEFALTRTGYKKGSSRQLGIEDPPCIMYFDSNVTSSNAPASFDWRDKGKVSPVRNQGKCGSCWAVSLIGNIESQYAISTNKVLQFSIQQLVDCVFSSEGCYGGDNIKTARTLISYGGVELETDYPYKAQNQNCSFEPANIGVKVVGCNHFDLEDEDSIKEALYHFGPLSIVLDAEMLSTYSGGVITHCPMHEENHAVLLVGYGTEKDTDYWIVKNSWGEKWGERGYFRLKRGVNACGLVNDKVVSAILDV